eukprot:TRINITY_DN32694_c0_g1_i1.p1 TRINITY_DN32694_c0_g1~~TRINITY_DN32694_c0_g1_i1.p1  ORF type:complete len:334 (-),score=85.41 TRINITY_DN32694_c0_g1_i1:243-1244(-)
MAGKQSIVIFCTMLALLALSSVERSAGKKEPVARKSDIPFIKCDVCQEMAKHLVRQFKKKKDEEKKLKEIQVIEMVERLCDPKRDEGEWILRLDMVESGTKLKLVEQAAVGECGTECKTIQKACVQVMGEHDTDIAETLFAKEMTRAALSKLLCNDLSKACLRKVPPLPKDRAPGEEFVEADAEKVKMDKMVQGMNDIPGAPKMKMYSRDDLMKSTLPGMGLGGDEDEDEDDEEDAPLSKAAKPSGTLHRSAPSQASSTSQASSKKASSETTKTAEATVAETVTNKVQRVALDVAETVKLRTRQAYKVAKDGAQQTFDMASKWFNKVTAKTEL